MDRYIAILMGVFLVMIFAAFIVFGMLVGSGAESHLGPQQVFEQHLLALDEERLDDALAYVDIAVCGTTAVDSTPQALVDLKRRGHTFSTAFTVEEVWILEDGSEALLGLRTPPNLGLPNVVRLTQVDGAWLLMCEE